MSIKIEFSDKGIFDNICGEYNCHIKIIEQGLSVKIERYILGDDYYYLHINGDNSQQVEGILQILQTLAKSQIIKKSDIKMMLKSNVYNENILQKV
jgi:hypothetical protein